MNKNKLTQLIVNAWVLEIFAKNVNITELKHLAAVMNLRTELERLSTSNRIAVEEYAISMGVDLEKLKEKTLCPSKTR